jgi:hypothetical protein
MKIQVIRDYEFERMAILEKSWEMQLNRGYYK